MPRSKYVLSEEKQSEAERLMAQDVPITNIGKTIGVRNATLRSLYPTYRIKAVVLSEEQELEIPRLMDQNVSIASIAQIIGVGEKTLRKRYPNYRTKAAVVLSEKERVSEAEKLIESNLSICEISRQLGLSHNTVRKYFPEYRTSKTKSTYGVSKKIRKNPYKGVKSSYIEKDALYNPARHGVVRVTNLTAQLLGDPPPGRRDMLERWSQNSRQ